jgi:16S rRNA processing protein RimM
MTQGMIVLGRIAGAYGLHGWVKLQTYGDDFPALGEMSQWWLGIDGNGTDWQPLVLEASKAHGKGWIAKFAGIEERNAAQALDGKYIAAPRDELPKTDKDEYYWADLVGMDVVNLQGERLGQVTSLLSTGAHDVLCVHEGAEGAKQERLLPFVAQVVKSVDTASRVIRVEWENDW